MVIVLFERVIEESLRWGEEGNLKNKINEAGSCYAHTEIITILWLLESLRSLIQFLF